MPNSQRLLTLAAALALAGCAAPRYQTVHRYEPPTGMAGQACVTACERTLDACRGDCRSAWQACTARVETQVEDRYAQALNAYAADLDRYRRELDRYDWDLWLGWGQGYGGLGYSPWPYPPWPGYYYPRPEPPPGQPTRDTVRTALHKEQCNDDCGCQLKYDDCYQGCGGRMIPERRCVANCPAKP